jgi:hypothetical protein
MYVLAKNLKKVDNANQQPRGRATRYVVLMLPIFEGFSCMFLHSHLCGYFPDKKFPRGFRRYLMDHAVYRDRHSRMLALLLAKAGLKIYFVMQHFFFDKLLESLNDVVGTFDMAGTADTNA